MVWKYIGKAFNRSEGLKTALKLIVIFYHYMKSRYPEKSRNLFNTFVTISQSLKHCSSLSHALPSSYLVRLNVVYSYFMHCSKLITKIHKNGVKYLYTFTCTFILNIVHVLWYNVDKMTAGQPAGKRTDGRLLQELARSHDSRNHAPSLPSVRVRPLTCAPWQLSVSESMRNDPQCTGCCHSRLYRLGLGIHVSACLEYAYEERQSPVHGL